MEEIRRALLEEEAAAQGSIYGTASCGGGSAVSLLSAGERREELMSTLNSVASSIFPSMTSSGMSRKWSSSTGGSASGSRESGGWEEEGEEFERDEEDEEDEGEMGEMLLSLPLPPMTLPSSKRNSVVGSEVEGAGEIRRRVP